MDQESVRPNSTKQPYEKPVLLDLEEVVAGCGFCVTGGSNAVADDEF